MELLMEKLMVALPLGATAQVGTSAATYVVAESGVIAALTVTGLCLGPAPGLHEVTGAGRLQGLGAPAALVN